MSRFDPEAYDSVARYAERADDYHRFRPSYPSETVDVLASAARLRPQACVADVGSGTGRYAKLLLDRGFRVLAIEPSRVMAESARRWLGSHSSFRQLDAAAERTTLPDRSVDAIVCAQSFHWFAAEEAVAEFRRILRPGGAISFLWNVLSYESDEFHRRYGRAIQRMCPDFEAYGLGLPTYSKSYFEELFGANTVSACRWSHKQALSLPGLIGRTASLSCCPLPGTSEHGALMDQLELLFNEFQSGGAIDLLYDVEMYCVTDPPPAPVDRPRGKAPGSPRLRRNRAIP